MLRLLKRGFRKVEVGAPAEEATPARMEQALRRPLFFCHVPKTAGTTLRSLLEQHYPLDAIASARQAKRTIGRVRTVGQEVAFLFAHYNAQNLLTDGFECVTMVREPLDRVRSLYRHWGQFTEYNLINSPAPERVNELKRIARTMPIEDFIRLNDWPVRRLFHNGMTNSLVPEFDEDAAKRLSDADRLEQACATLEQSGCVGVTDRYDDFVRLVCFHMHWPPPREHEPLNVRDVEARATERAGLEALLTPITHLDSKVFAHGRAIFERQYAHMLQSILGAHRSDDASVKITEAIDLELDHRARQRLVEAAANFRPPSHIAFDMRMPIRGTGWLEREGLDIQRPYRWTGPGTTATVDTILRRSSNYRARVSVISVIHEDILQHATLRLNGHAADSVRIEQNATSRDLVAEFRGSVDDDHFARLAIIVPRTATHLEVHPACGDGRRKGLAIERIEIESK